MTSDIANHCHHNAAERGNTTPRVWQGGPGGLLHRDLPPNRHGGLIADLHIQ